MELGDFLLSFSRHPMFDLPCRKVNILDTMVARLEKYAMNLEEIVAQRTSQLMDEKKKTDSLLYRMLPKYEAVLNFLPELVLNFDVF